MSTRSARALRGAVFASIATVTAATAHTLGGAGAPSPLFCAVLAVLLLPLATALAGPRPRVWRTVAAVASAQALFHGAFAVTGDLGRWRPLGGHAHHGAPSHGTDAIVLAVAATPMIAAHALAAVVTILAVLRGERLLRGIAAEVPRLLRRLIPALPGPAPRRAVVRVTCSAPLRLVRLQAGAVRRRGPPVRLLPVSHPAI